LADDRVFSPCSGRLQGFKGGLALFEDSDRGLGAGVICRRYGG